MGRVRRRQKQQRQGKRAPKKDDRDGFPAIVKQNKDFEAFYKRQNIVPEAEWDEFMNALVQPLPTTFRVTGAVSRGEASEFMRILKRDYFPLFQDLVIDDEKVEAPSPLPWYPIPEHAWKLSLGRTTLRKNPKLSELHACIRIATESGHISRQEAVSMIPPLLLDVKSHHKVLDMCAAPGSKTAQLIEMLHEGCDSSIPDGFVIANDIDNNRCYTMTHQVKRLQSPCVLMINENAASMPAFLQTKDSTAKDYIFFDRILADVPCSGDGTMRKNPDIWFRWNVGNGRGLHTLQKRILFRGVRMLAVGGRLVYSTCSFNPIENEAVVACALRTFSGSLRLIDVSDKLPGLVTIPGLTSWSVHRDADGTEQPFKDIKTAVQKKYRKSMWPPSEEEIQQFNLTRCVRILPHHNDTGGFFIAVLEKTADTRPVATDPDEEEKSDAEDDGGETKVGDDAAGKSSNNDGEKNGSERKAAVTGSEEADDGSAGEPPQKKRRFHGYKEDPFIFFKDGEELWPAIRDFYELTDAFPYGQFLGRCEGPKRNIYFSSAAVKQFMDANADRFKVINLGVKALSRNGSPYCDCQYRLTQDAISVLRQFVTKRVVRLAAADIAVVLSTENPFVEKLSASAQEQLAPLKQGGLVFIYEPNGVDDPQCSLTLCGWKGLTSVRSFTPKLERQFYLLLCGNKEFTQAARPRDARKERNEKDNDDTEETTTDSPAVTANTEELLDEESSPKQLDAESSPKLLDAESSPKQLDAESSPKQLDAESSPKQLDAESSPKLLDAESSPKQLDAESSPKQLDAESSPKQLDAESSPKQLDAESSPKLLDAESSPKQQDQDDG